MAARKYKSEDERPQGKSAPETNSSSSNSSMGTFGGTNQSGETVGPGFPIGKDFLNFQNLSIGLNNAKELATEITDLSSRTPHALWLLALRQSQNFFNLMTDPLNLRGIVGKAGWQFATHPFLVWMNSKKAMTDFVHLWKYSFARATGFHPDAVVEPANGDSRFRNEKWQSSTVHDILKQTFLIWANNVSRSIDSLDNLDARDKRRLKFYTRQFVDALAPTNFPLTNPDVVARFIETKGHNFIAGLNNWLTDIEREKGNIKARLVDDSNFEVGRNLATTPGQVIYQNDLMQLIQYTPATEKVHQTPILFVSAWINKFYILDLQSKNSMIKWAVEQGYTVFAISWINPDEKLAMKTFEDYMTEGPLTALTKIEEVTGSKKVNVAGYCLGGTLSTATTAYLRGKGDETVNSLTMLTTLTDFTEPGDLCVFIDKQQLDNLDKKMEKVGYLDGAEMSATFNMLRDADLIWTPMVSTYLMGKEPPALDLLAWNCDSTRMPARMHSFYLRKMYLENKLVEPGGLTLNGQSIDLRKVDVPTYQLSTKEDHIAPWKSTYAATQLFTGDKRFVLSYSGHIAGVVNPPANKKGSYWINSELSANPENWLEKAQKIEGSWWQDWSDWLNNISGEMVDARAVPQGIEPAPGSYVKVKLGAA